MHRLELCWGLALKAKVEKKGNLAFVTTEVGQQAVIPWDSLCTFVTRYRLEVEVEGGEMPRCIEAKAPSVQEVISTDESVEESDNEEG